MDKLINRLPIIFFILLFFIPVLTSASLCAPEPTKNIAPLEPNGFNETAIWVNLVILVIEYLIGSSKIKSNSFIELTLNTLKIAFRKTKIRKNN